MTVAIDTRSRRLIRSKNGSLTLPPRSTRGPSSSLAEFAESVKRLFRASPRRRMEFMARVERSLQRTRYPEDCIKILADEATNRGGMDGLDLAAEVLSKFPIPLHRVIDSYFQSDSGRRKADRALGRPRYRISDEIWGVYLDALARSDATAEPTTAFLATLRRVERSATLGMLEGIAVAGSRLAERNYNDKSRALSFLKSILTRRIQSSELSITARQALEGTISDLEG